MYLTSDQRTLLRIFASLHDMLATQTLRSWPRADEAQAAGARAAELEAEVARLHDLTTRLEEDLAAASGGGSGGGAKAQRSSSVGASVGGDITCVLSAAAAASEDDGGGEGGGDDAAASGERSMVEVLCAQRDRLRDRAARLEEGAGLGVRVVGFKVEWGSWLAGRELKSFARALRRGVQRCLAARRCWMQGDAAVAQLAYPARQRRRYWRRSLARNMPESSPAPPCRAAALGQQLTKAPRAG